MSDNFPLHVNEVIEEYGKCLELIPIDPHFKNISVSLYEKNNVATVWTFSRKSGVSKRIEQIRDQLAKLGDLEPIETTNNQLRSSCGIMHTRPLKFLMMQAVEKSPDYSHPEGLIKDLRSDLLLGFSTVEMDGSTGYQINAKGEAPNLNGRLRAITSGFVRYGEMIRRDNFTVSFSCGAKHNPLMQLLLPYARNVTGTQDMLEADSLRGQMTTGTLGFSPPT
tara:strand:+ start:3050 stop:3715 length:666 start_codon:yes stop_codon:yes gene_type:complete